MNIFQSFKKKKLLDKLNYDEYRMAPEYLKNDVDVLEKLYSIEPVRFFGLVTNSNTKEMIDKGVINVNNIQSFKIESFLNEYPSYVSDLDFDQYSNRFLIANKNTDIFLSYLSQDVLFDLVSKYNDMSDFISFINEEKQTELLDVFISNGNFNKYYSKFSGEVILNNISRLEENLSKIDIGEYGSDIQKKLLSSVKHLDKIDFETVDLQTLNEFVNGNEYLVRNLPNVVAERLCVVEPKYLSFVSPKFLRENIDKFSGNLHYASPELLLGYNLSPKDELCFENLLIENSKLSPRFSKREDFNKIWDLQEVIPLEKYSQTFPNLAVASKIDGDNFSRSIDKIMDLYASNLSSLDYGSEILKIINDKYVSNINNDDVLSEFNSLSVVLTNLNVLNECDKKTLEEFVGSPNMNSLIDVVDNVYGNEASNILRNRPNMEVNYIPNLDIFDHKVFDKFGYGMVENLLNYNNSSAYIISKLVNNSNLFDKFEQFSLTTDKYFEDNFNDIELQLKSFNDLERTCSNLDYSSFTNDQINNLILYINDKYNSDSVDYSNVISSIDELTNYEVSRNKKIEDSMERLNSCDQVKDAIYRRYFGVPLVGNKGHHHYNPDATSILNYNLGDFTRHEETINSGNFTDDELDCLEVFNIINKIDNVETLKEIYKKFGASKEMISPFDFKNVVRKVDSQYTTEITSSLFKIDDSMKENKTEGIKYRNDEGLDIITLDGAKFNMYVSYVGDTSSVSASASELKFGSKSNSIYEVFNNFEKGCSTISGSLISSDMLRQCGIAPELDSSGSYQSSGINLGFNSFKPEQILGMYRDDAHVSHDVGQINPEFWSDTVGYNYSRDLLAETATKGGRMYSAAINDYIRYNEITISRYNNSSNITNNSDIRVMPDYLVVYGSSQNSHKEIAKQFQIPIVEINVGAYGFDLSKISSHQKQLIDRKHNGEMLHEVEEMAGKSR